MKTALIWNVTTKVAPEVNEAWLTWVKQEYIPAFLTTGLFFDAVILKLLQDDTDDGPTYAVQFHAASKANFEEFMEAFYPALESLSGARWGEDCFSFESVLEVVD